MTFAVLYFHLTSIFRWDRLIQSKAYLSRSSPEIEDSAAPFISVIVPARNEEENIATFLASLLAQSYPAFEIVAVNDGSTDRTLEVIKNFASRNDCVKVVDIQEKPDGWAGKTYALHRGREKAGGDLLLFMDADTSAEHTFIARAVNHLMKNGLDFITFAAKPIFLGFWDGPVLAIMGARLCDNIRKVNDAGSTSGGANGAFLLFNRKVYNQVGGFEGVKNEVLEDQILGEKVKRLGAGVAYLFAPEFLTQKMYAGSEALSQAVARVFYHGGMPVLRKVVLAILAPLILCGLYLTPWLVSVLSIPVGITLGWWFVFRVALALLGLVTLSVYAYSHYLISRIMRTGFTYFLLEPLAVLILCYYIWKSILGTFIGKQPVWKGRAYGSGG